MWTSFDDYQVPVLYLPMGRRICQKEGTLHVCGELCAQKLQSQFMGNVRENVSDAYRSASALRAAAANRNCCGSNLLLGNRHPSEQGARVSPYSA